MEGADNVKELTQWIEADDAKRRARRAERLQELLRIMPVSEGWMSFRGGIQSTICFEEVRRCYLDGSYLAVVLLCLAYMERELAAQLYSGGWEPAKRTALRDVLRKAYEDRLLTEEEWRTYRDLAKSRNAHAHFRAPLSETTLEARSVGASVMPDEVLETDARRAVVTMAEFVKRQSGQDVAPEPSSS